MSEHPDVTVINRMTAAVFENDRDTLAEVFTKDMEFHVQGPLPRPGDHRGVVGFLDALDAIFELTDGDVKIEQLFCSAEGPGRRSGSTARSGATATLWRRTTRSYTGSRTAVSPRCG